MRVISVVAMPLCDGHSMDMSMLSLRGVSRGMSVAPVAGMVGVGVAVGVPPLVAPGAVVWVVGEVGCEEVWEEVWDVGCGGVGVGVGRTVSMVVTALMMGTRAWTSTLVIWIMWPA